MDKTIFLVKEMDCLSEEQMVRMKLSHIESVKKLLFDLTNRNVTVFHEGDLEKIKTAIDSLSLGSNIIETTK